MRCDIHVFNSSSSLTLFTKVYQGVDAQDKEFLTLFGTFCSATKQLPPSASLSAELSKSEDVAVAPAGITDLWRGQLRGACVAIKAFRACPAQYLEEAEEVCMDVNESSICLSKPTDPAETSPDVEEACSSKYCRISRHNHTHFPTRACV